MTTEEIYSKYLIPPNLQEHQRRVASVAKAILSSSRTPIRDPSRIIDACLYHDMANIIKFDFQIPGLIEIDKIKYWQGIQANFIKEYGTNIHNATITICKEIGLPDQTIKIIELAEWDFTPKLIESNNIESAILVYSDMRIGPFGILSAKDRITNLASRNSGVNLTKQLQHAKMLEQFIQPQTATNLNSLTSDV